MPMTNDPDIIFSTVTIRAPFWGWSIPPGQKKYSIFVRCPAEGLSQVLSPGGNHIMASTPHMHEVGKRMKVYIVRDGKEIQRFDSYFDHTHQINA